MRGRLAGFVAFLAFVAAGCAGQSEQSRYLQALPAFEEIDAVDVQLYPAAAASVPAHGDEPGQVRFILDQLRSARLSGPARGGTDPLGHDTPVVRLLGDGRQLLAIMPALNCGERAGTSFCRVHPRHVVVVTDDGSWRLTAPELARWLNESWREEWQEIHDDPGVARRP